jgi:PAS domain S-box-containing protein
MLRSPDTLPILIVDDDRHMLRTLGDILRLRGYPSLVASSARQGLELARSAPSPLAIALIDLGLPDMDGLELVSAVRRISPNTQVLILTGNASVDSAVRALRENSYDYLIKPVAPDQLVSSIERAGERWQRRRAEAARQDSEERLRRIFEHVSDALFITDAAGHVTDANRAAAELTGIALRELQAGTRTLAAVLGVEDPGAHPAVSSPASDSTGSDALSGELRVRHANGTTQVVDVRAATFAPGLVVHTVRDLTNERRLEEELHHSQKMEAIGRLAGGVAHDFNNVLTTIGVVSQLVLETLDTQDERRTDMQDILAATRRAAGLTRQLLAFSRKQIMQPRVLDLAEVVSGMERMLGRLIGEDVELSTTVDNGLWTVRADPGQLEQVIMNLGVNARDAMPDGGRLLIAAENLTLHVPRPHENGVVPAGDYVLLRVADTGCGMDPGTQARMFEPFFTTKAPGKGTGLGLSTVYGIIKQSGGHLVVHSTVDAGTEFVLYLPRTVATPVAGSAREDITTVAAGRATILLVEDDTSIRALTHRILTANGYQVLDAASGERALAILGDRAATIDLLVTDVVLPGMSGRELADRLRAINPGTRVLYMSGYTDDEVVHRGVMDLSRGLLVKPFTANELTRKIHAVLSRPARMN